MRRGRRGASREATPTIPRETVLVLVLAGTIPAMTVLVAVETVPEEIVPAESVLVETGTVPGVKTVATGAAAGTGAGVR